MQIIVYFFLLFFNTNSGITVPELAGYYDKEETFELSTIDKAAFVEFENYINEGINNGVYWIRISDIKNLSYIVEFPNIHIDSVEIFKDGQQIDLLGGEHYPSAMISSSEVIYVKVLVNKEAFIPVNFYTLEEYKKHQSKFFRGTIIFYVFALFIFIINIVFWIDFNDRVFLYYALFELTLILSLFYTDGLFHFIFPNTVFLTLEAWIHIISAILSYLYVLEFAQLRKYFPGIRYLIIPILVTLFCFGIAYEITHDYFYFLIIEIGTLLTFAMVLFSTSTLIKKLKKAKYFTITYIILLSLATYFYLGKSFGYDGFILSNNSLKLANALEMLVLTYANILRYKAHLKREKKEFKLFQS